MSIINAARSIACDVAREEDGSQVVEYSLVIALVSIALALGLSVVTGSTPFATLASRIASCFTVGATTC